MQGPTGLLIYMDMVIQGSISSIGRIIASLFTLLVCSQVNIGSVYVGLVTYFMPTRLCKSGKVHNYLAKFFRMQPVNGSVMINHIFSYAVIKFV